MKLTPKQQAFCDYYIEIGNATEAAKKAGYKGENLNRIASENLSKLVIKQYIEKQMAEKAEERVASQDEILHFLTQVMRGETTEQMPVGQGEGYFEFQDKDTYIKDRVKAAELLGKRHMMWTEKKEVSITVPTFVDDVPTDDE
ncbi:terminase small subunit [Bacillus cereus]